MKNFHWDNDKYGVGHPLLDRQHQTIAGLINQLLIDANDSRMPELYHFTLKELITFADNHLAYEEKLLADVAFPELTAHIAEHQKYRDTVQELTKGLNELPVKACLETVDFFAQWWSKHILEEDAQYKPYIGALID